jgi:hypothetical protein
MSTPSPVRSAGAGHTSFGPAVVSRECDLAVRLLMVTIAQHRRTEDALAARPVTRGRLRVLAPDTVQSRTRHESILVRCVSIMEAHVHGQLVSRLAPLAPPPRTDLVERLYAQFEEKGITSWVETDDYFKKHVHKSVKIKTYSYWNQVDAVIEARNAVVHGLGRFTTRQVRRGVPKAIESHLKRLNFEITTDRARVLVTRGALEETAMLLRGYLEWLDHVLAGVP